MGRVSINCETNVSNNKKNRQLFDSQTRLKKKKRRKDLEQLRSNVLAAKQNLVCIYLHDLYMKLLLS